MHKLNLWPQYRALVRTRDYVYHENLGKLILPTKDYCLAAFEQLTPEEVKVVIVGQDPYHSFDKKGNPKACGRAFAYHPKYVGPPNSSMQNIIREIGMSVESFDTSLIHWTRQGVLLLNTCLTVEAEAPLSHAGKYGWEQAISDILKFLSENSDCIYIGWGNKAQNLLLEAGVSEERTVSCSHPSRYSAHAGSRPFIGSKWHLQVNDKLKANGRKEIVW